MADVTAASAVIKLHPDDDVAIARQAITRGTTLDDLNGLTVLADIPEAHKVAVRSVAQGSPVRRYGQIIGFATQAIEPGEHVHVHNLAMGDFERDYAFGADMKPVQSAAEPLTFMGIKRPD